jgi:hypothetical protein
MPSPEQDMTQTPSQQASGPSSSPTDRRRVPSAEVRDWRSTAADLIDEVRRSEVLTREDLAIRINARD